MTGRYCIREDYHHREHHEAPGTAGRESYWTAQRIRLAGRYQYQVYALARRLADQQRAVTVLDVGCGAGVKLNRFFGSGFSVFGIDTEEGVAACRRLGLPGVYVSADLNAPSESLRNRLDSPDIIICADVIEHLGNPDRLMAFLAEICKPSTVVVLSTPGREELLGPNASAPSIPEHCREWSTREFAAYVSSMGFAIIQHVLLPPFRFGTNWMTARYILPRLITGRTLETTQAVVCRPVNG